MSVQMLPALTRTRTLKTYQQTVGEDQPTPKERIYRPALERKASEFYDVRERRRQAKKEENDLKDEITKMMDEAGLKMYRGKTLECRITGRVNQIVDIEKAVGLVSLEKLFELGLLAVSKEDFEAYLKETGIQADPSDYLSKGKPSTIVDVKLYEN